MNRASYQNLGLFGKLLMLFFVVFFFTIIGLALVTLLYGGNPTDINSLKGSQLIISIFMFIFPPLVCGYLWYNNLFKSLHLTEFPSIKVILLTMIIFLSLSPFINLLAYINEQMVFPDFLKGLEQIFREMEDKNAEVTEKFLSTKSLGGLLFNILLVAIVPALGEELLFRGSLLNTFSEKIKNKHIVIWIVAIIFSLIHFQMYGFLPRMVLGALLGYLLVWSRSLWLPIIAHFTNNVTATIVFYIGQNNERVKALEELGKAETIFYGVISLVVSAIIGWIIYKNLKEQAN